MRMIYYQVPNKTMKRLMTWASIALLGFTFAGTITAKASMNDEPKIQAQENEQHPRGGARGRGAAVDPQKYSQNKLDAIAKAAGLTEEEKTIVGAELKKFDDTRLQTWMETRKVHEEIEQLGDKATDKHYRDALQKLANLSAKRQKANQDFISAISSKLTPKKAYLVQRSYRNFNANTGRRLRQR